MSEWMSLCVAVSLFVTLSLLAGYFLYSGLLSDIIILTGSPPIKKVTFVYKFKEGPYKKCFDLFKEANSIGPELSCIGIFYDDPKQVPGPQCRCAVGSIVSEGEDKADEELLKRYETSGFHVFSFPEVTHVVTTSFPHRTILSILLGIKRVYPRLESYIKERKLCAHPFLEIYSEDLIHFMAPLARQGDFYVPEVRVAERSLSEQEEMDSDSEISGADSNSEYSSGTGILLSDSRETSMAASSTRSESVRDREDPNPRGRMSRERSLMKTEWEQTDQEQEELHKDSSWMSLDPVPQLLGVVGGEE
ncbi:testis-expressed protein 264 isoform X1 [Phyllopteryx taeniolatus]|uniref:testis-expressed protein 264 isoform X1 n=1 Tax=Phyllopteryx taeniolatus TaxID=161469 RepID=UPI002AD431EB|nr:testis-expressed protein 264 isoform X1 [Phyllopteryx taeniolatus]